MFCGAPWPDTDIYNRITETNEGREKKEKYELGAVDGARRREKEIKKEQIQIKKDTEKCQNPGGKKTMRQRLRSQSVHQSFMRSVPQTVDGSWDMNIMSAEAGLKAAPLISNILMCPSG